MSMINDITIITQGDEAGAIAWLTPHLADGAVEQHLNQLGTPADAGGCKASGVRVYAACLNYGPGAAEWAHLLETAPWKLKGCVTAVLEHEFSGTMIWQGGRGVVLGEEPWPARQSSSRVSWRSSSAQARKERA